jgi:Arginase family
VDDARGEAHHPRSRRPQFHVRCFRPAFFFLFSQQLTCEMMRVCHAFISLPSSGADVVEVAPAYDHADITSIAAADIVHDFLSLFVSAEPPKLRDERQARKAKDEL